MSRLALMVAMLAVLLAVAGDWGWAGLIGCAALAMGLVDYLDEQEH